VQGLLSLQTVGCPGVPTPFIQASPVVQALPSLNVLVLSLVNTQPDVGLQESSVQGLLSLQTVGCPGIPTPFTQASPVVQALPSLKVLVLSLVNIQPDVGLQESSVQGLLSLQTVGCPGVPTPFIQASPSVHALPSLKVLVLSLVNKQPDVGLQESSVQGLLSLQTVGCPDVPTPFIQASPVVQALPSLNVLVLSLVNIHPEVGLQESSVQGLLSLQTVGCPGIPTPFTQASPVVQALPSLKGLVLSLVNTQPDVGLQESSVQGLLSLQTTGV
jgi:hypothetical protein